MGTQSHYSSSHINMKAAVIFLCLLVGCSSHVLNKRSLLGGRQSHGHGRGHHGHHGHHQPHHRQQSQGRHALGQRSGRDGDNHQHESEDEIRAVPTGYLPAADDYEYEDDLAGYNTGEAGAEGRGQAQYNDQQGQYGDDQYDYNDQDPAASDIAKSAEDGYGAPSQGAASNIDTSYAAPDAAGEDYDALEGEEASGRETDDEYGAPRAADEEYGAPGSGFPFSIVEGRQGDGEEGSGDDDADDGEDATKVCPGGSLDACVAVCPGITAKVYGACVQGCADRCIQG